MNYIGADNPNVITVSNNINFIFYITVVYLPSRVHSSVGRYVPTWKSNEEETCMYMCRVTSYLTINLKTDFLTFAQWGNRIEPLGCLSKSLYKSY